jgi:glutaredoxin-like protein
MALIDERTREEVARRLLPLTEPVSLTLRYAAEESCPTCPESRELVETLGELAPGKVMVELVEADPGQYQLPQIEVSRPGETPRVMFQGLPSGFEFATLIDAVERVGGAGSGFSESASRRIDGLDHEVEVTVFVTPSCPYCPSAASLANRMALASEKVRARTVEANEFPELSQRHGVRGVPHTVVNGGRSFVGALPEEHFVERVLSLAAASQVSA